MHAEAICRQKIKLVCTVKMDDGQSKKDYVSMVDISEESARKDKEIPQKVRFFFLFLADE